MAFRKRVKIVEVAWEDSMHTAGWKNQAEWEEFEHDPEPECRSAGYLNSRTKKGIVLAQSENRSGGRAEFLFIPRSAIRRVTVVMEAKAKS